MLAVELIPDPDQGGFTARIPDIPAYGEGETEDEAISDLKEAVLGYIETFGLEDALARVSQPAIRQIDWNLRELAVGNLPRPSGKDMIRFLVGRGFTLVRVCGSHHFLEGGALRTSVPVEMRHSKLEP